MNLDRLVSRRWPPAVLGLAGLCMLGCVGDDAAQKTQTLPDDALACVISSPTHTYRIGEVPQISVQIFNRSDRPVVLLGSLDGSAVGRRLPRCHFEIDTPYGTPPIPAVCGNMNRLRAQDFVTVPSGGTFNPYQEIDEYGFFGDYRLSKYVFSKPGEYRVRYIYTTAEPGLAFYGEGADNPDRLLERLWNTVPRVTLRSNELRIEILEARP